MAENAESIDETEVVEDQVVEEAIEKEPGEEIEPTGEAEKPEEQVEGEEVEVVLEGEEEPAPQKIPKRVRKLLERNTQLQSDLDVQGNESAQEIERLRQELANATQPAVGDMPLPPTEESSDYDPVKLAAAQAKYRTDMQTWILNQATDANQVNAAAEETNRRAKAETTALESHYKRVDSLKVSNYDDNEAEAVSVLGRDMVKSIAMMLPNSAMVINYLGTNGKVAQELADLDKTDPGTGVAKLWELNFKLKTQPRKRSNAPNPEERVQGSAAATTDEAFIAKMDKAASSGDITLFRKLKKEAREKGIKF